MGKLNLLHHKSWHVYSKENQEKVKKDEKEHERRKEEGQARIIKAEQEARLENLRLKNAKDAKDARDAKDEHVNLFKELEKSHGSAVLIDQKDVEQKQWEDKHTMYLGETRDGKKEAPWYNEAYSSLLSTNLTSATSDGQKRYI